MIQVRYSTSPSGAETATTADLRESFLVPDLFAAGEVRGTYTHDDRLVVGGAVPGTDEVELPAWTEVLGTASHLEGRELGVINVGGAGHVVVDDEKYELDHLDGLFVGRGSQVTFGGADAAFYFVSAPAHATYPTTALRHTEVEPVALGSAEAANERNLFRYAWGQELQTSVLQFGVTVIASGSVWNTFPPHLHDRRTEIYCYVDLEETDRVFHFLGQPGATRHLVMRNREAVISPPWSIHAGAGTGSYAFIWAMAGENNVYTDLSPVALEDL
ncbi:5-dehydro-4-deoxy-D-glucuronate isomerase [Promicromonospora thailandica]|uniref:5-dehydro-4-deoxy-D-glucuronate isomerase n=1 Tax=Promicromonospora thailandica TaxID=765201 RepID=A0A9X2FXC1_9MICO|nr:5-dehydro-4-deoxy-D-glucuronate isomerase [Promicromonospora thailandica]MCP2263050.1 4-deoxy-L-threo-5-hexosulose-uronate ketol-isomerase [Promicromonospora thailandica]BFF18424.1 5-dehydro-4-deoxy-D-glucuronate isomerase [Promicromonospora thailandica]